jgi:hypothetical protein
VENHVYLVFYGRWGRTHKAGAFMQWSFQLLWPIAFTFNAKVMATAPKTAQGDAVFDVGDEA